MKRRRQRKTSEGESNLKRRKTQQFRKSNTTNGEFFFVSLYSHIITKCWVTLLYDLILVQFRHTSSSNPNQNDFDLVSSYFLPYPGKVCLS